MGKKSNKNRGIKSPKRRKSVRVSERRSKSVQELVGVLSMARDGFGFVTAEGFEDDIFIPYSKMHGALNGDTVKVAVSNKKKEGKKQEGEVIAIVERSNKPHIGVLSVRGNQVWAIDESSRMPYDIKIPMKAGEQLPQIGGKQAANGV
ncbi:MAG: hypothetical protein J6Z27_02155, partial [Bacteroidales bacterium]|nr:hypothetical protein [Bacteroidales bacterium]